MTAPDQDLEMQRLPDGTPVTTRPPSYSTSKGLPSTSKPLFGDLTSLSSPREDSTDAETSASPEIQPVGWFESTAVLICAILGFLVAGVLVFTVLVFVFKYVALFFSWWFDVLGILGDEKEK